MLVSAISANSTIKTLNTKGGDNNGDAAFSSLTSYAKRSNLENEMTGLYDSINEWKSFCHKQILSGKLDIIA